MPFVGDNWTPGLQVIPRGTREHTIITRDLGIRRFQVPVHDWFDLAEVGWSDLAVTVRVLEYAMLGAFTFTTWLQGSLDDVTSNPDVTAWRAVDLPYTRLLSFQFGKATPPPLATDTTPQLNKRNIVDQMNRPTLDSAHQHRIAFYEQLPARYVRLIFKFNPGNDAPARINAVLGGK